MCHENFQRKIWKNRAEWLFTIIRSIGFTMLQNIRQKSSVTGQHCLYNGKTENISQKHMGSFINSYTRRLQNFHGKLELKDIYIGVKKDLKCMHRFFMIHIFHELFEVPVCTDLFPFSSISASKRVFTSSLQLPIDMDLYPTIQTYILSPNFLNHPPHNFSSSKVHF